MMAHPLSNPMTISGSEFMHCFEYQVKGVAYPFLTDRLPHRGSMENQPWN
jgi:hypothetical protein